MTIKKLVFALPLINKAEMSKRKHPEESTTEVVADVESAPSVVPVDELQEPKVVAGWVIGEEPTDSEEEVSVSTVDPELEREDGWEVEAFWALLARAGYVRW